MTIDKRVTETPLVAKEVSVHVEVEPVEHPPERSVPFSREGIASEAAMDAYRRCGLQVPFTGIVLLEGLVGEYAGRADFNQIAAEFAFERTVLVTSEIDMIVG